MNNNIVSIGTVNPGAPIPQLQISRFMKVAHGLDDSETRKLNFVYRHSGIETRHSVLPDFNYEDPFRFSFFPKNNCLEPFPSTQQRMAIFKSKASGLASLAISNCLAKTTVRPEDITHLILVSCTGMYAPGVEIEIIQQMGIRKDVERFSIQFMGCYAAFNAIKLADRICNSDRDARILVVSVELCTIHFQKYYNEDNLIANAIFGDGAAAALVCNESQGLRIKKYNSQLVKEGENEMAWSIGNFGFEMRLSKYVPELLNSGIKKLFSQLDELFNLSQISNFAIHPGGKQILIKVEEAFGISCDQNQPSHEILGRCGNMSSASILFVLEKWMDQKDKIGDILAMGFGPGLTLETLLLEK